MNNVKILSIRRDGNSTAHPQLVTHRRFYNPLTARVKREGSRGSDNMDFSLDINSTIRENDEVYYIQDIVDLTNLKGIWNFYGNFRDESGYEQDDYYTGDYDIPEAFDSSQAQDGLNEPNGKFRGYYKTSIKTTSNGRDGLKMIRAFNQQSNTNKPIFDLSGNFDIYFWVRSTYYQGVSTLIDMLNDNSTVNKGLLLEIDNDNDYLKLSVNDGTSSTVNVIRTPDNSIVRSQNHLLRVTRLNGVFKIFVDNVEQTLTGTTSYSGDLNDYNNTNTHNYFYLFKKYNRSTSSFIDGTGGWILPYQLRFYNDSLSDSEASKIFTSKPQQMTMKFGGIVWKIEDGLKKKYKCLGFSSQLFNRVLNSDILSSATTVTNVTRNGTIYTSGKSYQILKDILNNIGSDEFVYVTDSPTGDAIQYNWGDFSASGTFLDIITLLIMLNDNRDFFSVLPRKVLLIERYIDSNYIINDKMFRVIDHYYDDTNTVNYLECVGNTEQTVLNQTTNLGYISSSEQNQWTDWSIFYEGFTDRIADFVLNFKVNGNEIEEYSGTGTPTSVVYELSDDLKKFRVFITSTGSHSANIRYATTYVKTTWSETSTVIKEDPQSIKDIGLYSKRLNIPQLKDSINLLMAADSYIETHKDVNQRVKVMSNSLINSVNIGQNVGVHYDTKNLIDTTATTESKPLRLKVASIEWKYPETTTTIELGENEFNSFDIEKSESDSNRNMGDMLNRKRGL